MTVQELIDQLETVENKTKEVLVYFVEQGDSFVVKAIDDNEKYSATVFLEVYDEY